MGRIPFLGLVYLRTMAMIDRILRAAFFLESDPLAWNDCASATSMNRDEKRIQQTVIVNTFFVRFDSIFYYFILEILVDFWIIKFGDYD